MPYDDGIYHFHIHHRLEESQYVPAFSPFLPQFFLFRRNVGLDGAVFPAVEKRHRLSERFVTPGSLLSRLVKRLNSDNLGLQIL